MYIWCRCRQAKLSCTIQISCWSASGCAPTLIYISNYIFFGLRKRFGELIAPTLHSGKDHMLEAVVQLSQAPCLQTPYREVFSLQNPTTVAQKEARTAVQTWYPYIYISLYVCYIGLGYVTLHSILYTTLHAVHSTDWYIITQYHTEPIHGNHRYLNMVKMQVIEILRLGTLQSVKKICSPMKI